MYTNPKRVGWRRLTVIVTALTAAGVVPAAAGVVASGTTPDGDEWQAVVEAAKEEGTVTLYTEQIEALAIEVEAAFEAAYPEIDLVFVRGTPGDMQAKLDAEVRSGAAAADLYVATETKWFEANLDVLTEILSPAVSSEPFASNLADAGTYLGPISGSVLGLGWNTSLVSEPVADFTDLLRPEFENSIAFVSLDVNLQVEQMKFFENTYGPDFLTELAAQRPQFLASGAQILQATIAGEFAGAGWASAVVLDSKEAGAPVDFVTPPAAYGTAFHVAPLAQAPHPNAAQVLIDWYTSEAGQTALGNRAWVVRPGIPGTLADADQITMSGTLFGSDEELEEYRTYLKDLFGQ